MDTVITDGAISVRPIFFHPSSHSRLNLLSYDRKPTEIQAIHTCTYTHVYPHASSSSSSLSSISILFFQDYAIQLYCSRLSVRLLSYASKSSLIRLDGGKKWMGIARYVAWHLKVAICLFGNFERMHEASSIDVEWYILSLMTDVHVNL